MINDSVREELKTKVTYLPKPFNADKKLEVSAASNPIGQTVHVENQVKQPPPAGAKVDTSEFTSNPTSPTLIEFHSKNATLPEWRLQLQNTIRQRSERGGGSETSKSASPPVQTPQLLSKGATALKMQPAEKSEQIRTANPTLASALQRIKDSRQQFLVEEKHQAILSSPATTPTAPNKNYPFHIAPKTDDASVQKAQINPPVIFSAKPKLAEAPLRKETEDLDTNKLRPIPQAAKLSTSFEKRSSVSIEEGVNVVSNIENKVEVKASIVKPGESINVPAEPALSAEAEVFDDCAPIAMRFNAGFFDLIIGLFASLILLSPFLLWGGSWWSFAGVSGFFATFAIIMFGYLTAAIGYFGKTFGMRLFSLEVIDIGGENYPTLHQAAVSSSLYLFSLALGGVGFLTLAFNEDKRAAHDLVSGTIVVREE
jgi:uncharacterized RDD family membrane protein YckC